MLVPSMLKDNLLQSVEFLDMLLVSISEFTAEPQSALRA